MQGEAYAVLDVGGTKLLLVLFDLKGEIVFKEKYPTSNKDEGFDLTRRINKLISEALETAGTRLKGLAICVPGPVDFNNGTIINTPNLPWEDHIPIGGIMQRYWSVPVIVENDANAAVLGEAVAGAGQGLDNVIYITVSTGIGAGFYLQGDIYRGSRGFAAEIGHTKNFGSRVCKCGAVGCLESEASGEAVAHKGEELLESVGGESINTAEVFKRSRENDLLAQKLVHEMIKNLALAFANLSTLLDPDVIIIGGGVSAEGASFIEAIKDQMMNYSYPPELEGVKLVKADLEPDSAIWGMYHLLKQN